MIADSETGEVKEYAFVMGDKYDEATGRFLFPNVRIQNTSDHEPDLYSHCGGPKERVSEGHPLAAYCNDREGLQEVIDEAMGNIQ